jgi:DNA-directed RNA polymerase subunit RPC12/RpoP
MSAKFKKVIEDFVCDNCGKKVKGDGYTNHCPHCLWSKHVDINPGDRANKCGGLMEPIYAEMIRSGHDIAYRCVKCGEIKHNRSHKNDDFETILKIVQKNIKKTFFE